MTTETKDKALVSKGGLPSLNFTQEQVDLIKRTVCKGATDDELALFLYVAKKSGLDPLARQIHAVKRWDQSQGREVMAFQTGIDGYRLTAERTGKYIPGREPTFSEINGNIVSATAYVRKVVAGVAYEIAATAYMAEYIARKKDGSLTHIWATKPHVMLAKCAEALALRKAFPAELSGVRADEEMEAVGVVVQSEADVMPRAVGQTVAAPYPNAPLPTIAEIEEAEKKDGELGLTAEEMAAVGADANQPELPTETTPPGDFISEAQRKRLFHLLKESGKTTDTLKAWLGLRGITSTTKIPVLIYEVTSDFCKEKA